MASQQYLDQYKTAAERVAQIIGSWNEGATTDSLNQAAGYHKGITDAQARNIMDTRNTLTSYMDPNNPYTKNMNLSQRNALRSGDLAYTGQEGRAYGALYDARVGDIKNQVAGLKEAWGTKVKAAEGERDTAKSLYDIEFGKEKMAQEAADAAAARAAMISAATISAQKPVSDMAKAQVALNQAEGDWGKAAQILAASGVDIGSGSDADVALRIIKGAQVSPDQWSRAVNQKFATGSYPTKWGL